MNVQLDHHYQISGFTALSICRSKRSSNLVMWSVEPKTDYINDHLPSQSINEYVVEEEVDQDDINDNEDNQG